MPVNNSPDPDADGPARGARGEVPAGAETPVRPPTGPAVIAAYLPTLTSGPGVYRMLDGGGTVIYVG